MHRPVRFPKPDRSSDKHKAALAYELIACLGAAPADALAEDYVEIAGGRIVAPSQYRSIQPYCRRQP